jgi:hypothetical protein
VRLGHIGGRHASFDVVHIHVQRHRRPPSGW